jgi:hypothetical protein
LLIRKFNYYNFLNKFAFKVLQQIELYVMDDPTVLTGLAKIVNKRKVNTKLNLDAIERDLISGGGLKPHPVKDVDMELNELLRDIRTQPFERERVMIKQSAPTSVQVSKPVPTASNKIQNFIQAAEPAPDIIEADSDDELEPEEFEPIDSAPLPAPIPMPLMRPPMSTPSYLPPTPPMQPYTVAAPRPIAMPQPIAGNYAQEALQVYANEHDVEESIMEQERQEDEKEKMLADIDDLRDELASDGISISRIPEVNIDSPYELVKKIRTQLKRKYDRSRCEDLGQGLVLAAARMVEMAFDGEKSYFGFRPDMTGWNRTVRSKMRRMRYEQSQIVSNALEYYNVGPISRMGLELVPSAFLYSLSRREQHGKDNYTPDQPNRTEDRAAALDDLRQFEN